MHWSARCGNLNAIKYAHKQGGKCIVITSKHQAKIRQLNSKENLQHQPRPMDTMTVWSTWLKMVCNLCAVALLINMKGCELQFDVIEAAATDLKCLKYVHEKGLAWRPQVCCKAAVSGKFECLKYAHENGAEWGFGVCEQAVMGGNVECLIYAHENGAPWELDVCTTAAKFGRLDCLIYAHEHGCTYTSLHGYYGLTNVILRYLERIDLHASKEMEAFRLLCLCCRTWLPKFG